MFILPASEYLNRFPENLPIHYVMDAKEGQYDKVDAFLSEYEKKPQANIKYDSSTKVVQKFQEEKKVYEITGGILAAIFGVIGILNLLNVTLTNAVARQQEFAVMQSIGMTRRQLRRLFVLEGLIYSMIAGILSLFLSGILSLTAVKGITSVYWYSQYYFTVLPACLVIPIYIIVAGLLALLIDRIWNNGSVVERLRRI